MKIWGNTVSTNMPRSDYNQTDPEQASFILNKPNAAIEKAQNTADNAQTAADEKLPMSGGKMAGDINMDGHTIGNVGAPVSDGDAVNKKYVTDRDTKNISVVLLASGWSAEAPYTQAIKIAGLTDQLKAYTYPNWPDDAAEELVLREETAKISSCRRSGSTMTFRCLEDKPTKDIPVTVEVYV